MPTSALASRRAWHFIVSAVLLLLVTGCQSTRVAYRFQPPAGTSPRQLAATPPDSGAWAVAPASAPQAVLARAGNTKRVQPARRQLRQQLRRAVAQAVARPAVSFRPKSAAQQVRRVAGPRHTTEVGLGTTVLGVLGLVVLPVALLGLLIWGGPVWAVLAALAALAVLVAYLDPFG